jgi:hypothetical protein
MSVDWRSFAAQALLFTALGLAQTGEARPVLPKWLSFSGEYRFRQEGFWGGAYRANNEDGYALSRIRLNLRIAPRSWMKLFFQGQDARVFGKNTPPGPPFRDTMDLRQAYLELGDSEKRSFALRVGRQELVYGEQRLIGHVSWLNTARSFDAVRAIWRFKNLKLDAFASSVVQVRDREFNRHADGDNFHGLYGSLQDWIPKATLEPYVLWRVAPRAASERYGVRKLSAFTAGARWVGKLPGSFDYGLEMAAQNGSVGADEVRAWAGHWQLGYTVALLGWKPRLIAEYNFASGDGNSADGTIRAFDQLYPTPHDKYGLADQVGWRNIRHLRFGAELKVTAKLTVVPNYHSFWLANPRDALYAASGAVIARSPAGAAGRHVGQEWDFQALVPVSKQIAVSGGLAHIVAGEFLKKATPGKRYTYAYSQVVYTF